MNRWHLKCAARVIHHGGIVAYPTESVYGLGCDPDNSLAVLELLAIKDRPIEKGLILIAADIQHLQPYMAKLDKSVSDHMRKTWPGPVTWLVPAHPRVPVWLRGKHDTIAVRIPAHPITAALCATFNGALVSTSANYHGHPPARNALRVYKIFGTVIDYILAGNVGKLRKPTEIRDALTNTVIRPA